jgi:hydroxymethylglutaryl-CoA reductase
LTLDRRSDLRFREGVEGEAGGDTTVIVLVLMQGQMQMQVTDLKRVARQRVSCKSKHAFERANSRSKEVSFVALRI